MKGAHALRILLVTLLSLTLGAPALANTIRLFPDHSDVEGVGWGYDNGNGCYWATTDARQKHRGPLVYVLASDGDKNYCHCEWNADAAHQLFHTSYRCEVTMRPSDEFDEMTAYGEGKDEHSAIDSATLKGASFFGAAQKNVSRFFCDQQTSIQHPGDTWSCYGEVWIELRKR